MASKNHLAIESEAALARIVAASEILDGAPTIELPPFPSDAWIRQNMTEGHLIVRNPQHVALIRALWVADVLELFAARTITEIPKKRAAAAA